MKATLVPVLLAALTASAHAQPGQASPSFEKVMIVVLENARYEDALQQPAFAQLARSGALLMQFHAETHPSQGNYIAMVAGNTYGVRSDDSVDLSVPHIGNLLDASSKTWKAYLEAYPGDCFLGSASGKYVRKHNPFASFRDIQADPSRCSAHLVDASTLADDVSAGTLPTFSLYIPDVDNSGHDTGIGNANRWFSQVFGPLMKDPRFMKGMLLVVTFDESAGDKDNHVFTALYGNSVIPGSHTDAAYDHYSILRTIENTLGTGTLRQRDASARPITGVWK